MGHGNVYEQADGDPTKPPKRINPVVFHPSRAAADWAAERVDRATGGAVYRVGVLVR